MAVRRTVSALPGTLRLLPYATIRCNSRQVGGTGQSGSAALAWAAAAGVPLTDRRFAQGAARFTARADASPDWRSLAGSRQTLAIYMGVAGLEALSRELLRHGRGAETPCALVENGSLPSGRVLAATLAEMPALARRHGILPRALLIVGEVAAQARAAVRAGRFRTGPEPATTRAA